LTGLQKTGVWMEEIETGDVFRAAYLLSQGGQVVRATASGGHVVLTLSGEALAAEDERYRKAAGLVEPLTLKENLNRLRDLVKDTLRHTTPDRRIHHGALRSPHPTC
jgi:hypothetical protein